jgi:hypothetical protein
MAIDVGGNIISSTSVTSDSNFAKNIITEGLICHLDAANINSYPGSGTTWLDLSPFKNNSFIYGSVPWTTVGGKTSFNFTADGHYMQSAIGWFPQTQLTYEAWIYPAASEVTSGDRGTIILCNGGSGAYMSWNKSNGYMSNYWYGHTTEGYWEQNTTTSRSAWHHWCCVWDNTNIHQWVDGTYAQGFGTSGTSTINTTLIIGRESSGRQFSGGIAIIRIYNRNLSGAEVLHNFNSGRSRFGI